MPGRPGVARLRPVTGETPGCRAGGQRDQDPALSTAIRLRLPLSRWELAQVLQEAVTRAGLEGQLVSGWMGS
ncbi:MAG: hypothetical protein IMX01_06315 [Limnochordaceae bacterium]|nr:hypothetical protein [Limnochordaceae bacterium]